MAFSFAVALIWAIHPLLTESVTYLTQRTELLMGLFFLLTLYCSIRGASSRHPRRWYAASIGACALGMGAKEVMAASPIVVLLYDRCFLSGSFSEAFRRRRNLYLGLAGTWAILLALLAAYPTGGSSGSGLGLAEGGPWEYARTQPGVILEYLRLSFWPRSLCLDYGWPIATSAWQIIPAASFIAALIALILWALRRAPALGFLGAAFFLILAPSSSFVPIPLEVAAERRMYLPLATIVAACVMAAYWLGNRLARRTAASTETHKLIGWAAAMVALFSIAGVLGWLTFDRNADYRDAITLWHDTVQKRPGNARAWNNLGCAYCGLGQVSPALPFFKKAIELKADYIEAYNNRGVACTSAGLYTDALRDFKKAIELKPDDAEAYCNMGIAHFLKDEFAEAVRDLDRAIALQPGYANAYVNRASVLFHMKEYDKALSDLRTFEKLGGQPDPKFVEQLLHVPGETK